MTELNPAFCPYCSTKNKPIPIIPVFSKQNLAECVKCSRMWKNGKEVEIIFKRKEYNPSKREKI